MAKAVIYRYKTSKPADGHFSMQLHEGSEIVGFLEYWHGEKGWECVLDVLCDPGRPMERRYFFLCTGGDDLSFLGDYPVSYHVATHYSKGYTSFLFETTHLSENERAKGRVEPKRLLRSKPASTDLGRGQRYEMERRERERAAR